MRHGTDTLLCVRVSVEGEFMKVLTKVFEFLINMGMFQNTICVTYGISIEQKAISLKELTAPTSNLAHL